jgi:hypothetical protein
MNISPRLPRALDLHHPIDNRFFEDEGLTIRELNRLSVRPDAIEPPLG